MTGGLAFRLAVYGILALFAAASMLSFDAFEAFFEFTRAHEDWELDEILMVALATLVGAMIAALDWAWSTSRRLADEVAWRREAQGELEAGRRMKAVGTLASGIAHSANNYLQPIATLTRLVRADLPGDHPSQPDLEKIESASTQASDLFRDILVFARPAGEDEIVCDAVAVTGRSRRILETLVSKTVAFGIDLPRGPVFVPLGGRVLADALLALVSNAADALAERGPDHGVGWNGRVAIAVEVVDDIVTIAVSDNGVGMSEDVRTHAFDPFFTTKAVDQGTGIGLSMVQSAVTGCGGKVRLESAPGEGCRITLELPRLPGG